MSQMVEQWKPLLREPITQKARSSPAADDRAYSDYATSHVAWIGHPLGALAL